jgi:hypothetical protein
MSCDWCGRPTPRQRLCKECSRSDRRDRRGGSPDGNKLVLYECAQCALHYRDAGWDGCPDCGSDRRRFVKEVEIGGEVATDGGQS